MAMSATLPPAFPNGVPVPSNVQPPESDARHEPLKLALPAVADDASVVPTVGTPLDPASIPIDPPSGTPPPPTGELLQDVQMAEEPSDGNPSPLDESAAESFSVSAKDVADHSMLVESQGPPVNGINGHHISQLDTKPVYALSPSSVARDIQCTLQPVATASEDDDQPPPAKRARKMSADAESKEVKTESHSILSHRSQEPVSSAPPSSLSQAASTMSPSQHRFCVSTIRILKKLKDAQPFLQPVDAIALGIPHYTTIIKNPMDLGTVEKKLFASHPAKPDPSKPRYITVDEFVKDVKLIFQNCVTFNGPEHAISQMGRRLETVFDKQMKQVPANEEPKTVAPKVNRQPTPPPPPPAPPKKVPTRRASTSVPTIRRSESDLQGRPKREIHPPAPKDLPYADAPRKARRTKARKDDGTQEQLKFCSKVLQELHKKNHWDIASPFYEPVDWQKLEIPSYPKIIKRPMDLSTMKKKLESGEYPTAQKFYDDFKLMIRNCFTFNPEGTLVNQAGVELQKLFDDKWVHLPPLREPSELEEDEEEEESDDDQAKVVAEMESQIEVLRGNLAAMKKKPKKEKKEKRKDKLAGSTAAGTSKSHGGKPYQPSKASKKSKKHGDDDSLTFEQKKDLSETIATLDGAKLERVIQIIHEGVPEIRDSTEEIELDIDSLPTTVLMKLYNFVLRPIRAPPKRSRGVGGGTGGLKRKSMDEDVEAERIRQLEERIALFEPNNGAGPGTGRSGENHESGQSSDDSSDDSSGSESE